MDSKLVELSLKAIDSGDKTFCLSFGRDPARLVRAMEQAGLVSPPLVVPKKEGVYRIVSGFLRVEAARLLDWKTIPARLLPGDLSRETLARLAFWDNAATRALNLVEEALALKLLTRDQSPEEAGRQWARGLGLDWNPGYGKRVLGLLNLPEKALLAVARGSVPFAVATLLMDHPQEESEFFAGLFSDLKLSLGKQRKVLELSREIAKKEGVSVLEIFREEPLASRLGDPEKDRGQVARGLLETLQRRRFPNLSRADDAMRENMKKLNLPANIRWEPPVFGEGQTHTLSVRVDGANGLALAAEDLDRLSRDPLARKLLGDSS